MNYPNLLIRREKLKVSLNKSLAAEADFSLDDVVNNKNKTQIGFAKAKYRTPDDFNKTWSGRGKKPKWVQDFIGDNVKLEDLLIIL